MYRMRYSIIGSPNTPCPELPLNPPLPADSITDQDRELTCTVNIAIGQKVSFVMDIGPARNNCTPGGTIEVYADADPRVPPDPIGAIDERSEANNHRNIYVNFNGCPLPP